MSESAQQKIREWTATFVMVAAVLLAMGAAYHRLSRVEADLGRVTDRQDRTEELTNKRFEACVDSDNKSAIHQARIETKLLGIEALLIEVRNDVKHNRKNLDATQ